MGRTGLLAIFVAVALLVTMPAWSQTPTTKPEPASQANSQPGLSARQDVATEKFSEGGVKFNSQLALTIWSSGDNGGLKPVGMTPASKPLTIPKCRWWYVQPGPGVTLPALLQEAKAQYIPGVSLANSADADLPQLSEWPKLRMLSLSGVKITDGAMVHLKRLKGLQTLFLAGTQVTDAGLADLKELKELRWLFLFRDKITDAGLVHLKEMTWLQSLMFEGASITDAGLVQLKELKGLQTLVLSGDNITDAGLVQLKELKGLQTLVLWGPNITDAGLVHLMGMKGLLRLNVSKTKITKSGLEELRKALPNTTIYE